MSKMTLSAAAAASALALAGCHRGTPEVQFVTQPPASMAAAAASSASAVPPAAGVSEDPAGKTAAPDEPTAEDVARFNQRVPK